MIDIFIIERERIKKSYIWWVVRHPKHNNIIRLQRTSADKRVDKIWLSTCCERGGHAVTRGGGTAGVHTDTTNNLHSFYTR